MMMLHPKPALARTPLLIEAAEAAARAIPPVWPLASSVAVNPFLGQAGESLATAGARLARVGGLAVTPLRSELLAKLTKGSVTDEDLAAALAASNEAGKPDDVDALKQAAHQTPKKAEALPTIADLAAKVSGIDWPGMIEERIGSWAAGYFDAGQALWAAPRGHSAYEVWCATATHDLTPEILGLKGFGAHVADAPETPVQVLMRAAERIGIEDAALETYFHSLLMSLGGWAQVARYHLWQAELKNGSDQTLPDLLAIRLLFEEALYLQYTDEIAAEWATVRAEHAEPVTPSADLVVDAILQEAIERAEQRKLANLFAEPLPEKGDARPELQAAFCIDVRSEVYRRALESVAPGIETIGFAGFFGLSTSHRRFGSDVAEERYPVLLNAGVHSCSGNHSHDAEEEKLRLSARAKRAWGRFKLAAVSSFAFVEAMGPVYVWKLVKDALGKGLKPEKRNDPAPRLDPVMDLNTKIVSAATVLGAMSLTKNFAPLVVLAGHGASVINNPHAAALQCGACGGYSGEVNARLLAGVLNDAQVRQGLAEKGIEVPADTLFVGALHDTTTDEMTLYSQDHPAPSHRAHLEKAQSWFGKAGDLTRAERALRLPRAEAGADIFKRSRDWSEVRPEWALAGCKAFVAAPRSRTTGRDLEGRSFLHSYDWKADEGFGVLELIMTAPVVVASWISLQYYGSSVAPSAFGGGNKLLHNVVGGIGVLEGNGGNLRPGLPMQSVHDGEKPMHDPLRLSVVIEAPQAAMTDILSRHDGVRALFDNGWLKLFAMDEQGRLSARYTGDLTWAEMS